MIILGLEIEGKVKKQILIWEIEGKVKKQILIWEMKSSDQMTEKYL